MSPQQHHRWTWTSELYRLMQRLAVHSVKVVAEPSALWPTFACKALWMRTVLQSFGRRHLQWRRFDLWYWCFLDPPPGRGNWTRLWLYLGSCAWMLWVVAWTQIQGAVEIQTWSKCPRNLGTGQSRCFLPLNINGPLLFRISAISLSCIAKFQIWWSSNQADQDHYNQFRTRMDSCRKRVD